MTITTNAASKVAAVATGLAMAFSMLGAAPLAHAQSASDLQAQIASLLATIQSLQAQLSNIQGGGSGGTSSCSFTVDLTIGSRGVTVTCLQTWLIGKGYSIPAGATGYFGAQTQAAVAAWQKALGITPAAGYFGAKSRAAIGGLGGNPNPGTPAPVGNGLTVRLSPTSPNNTALVQGQGIGDLGDFIFGNPTSMPIMVTGLTFNRIGVSNDSALNNVYLYNGVNRITDSAGVSSSQFSFSNAAGIFIVPAGMSITISVRADIANSTAGQTVGAAIVAVSSNGTLDSSVHFPINSGMQAIASATLASVSFSATTIPSTATSISPQGSYPVWQNSVSVSTNPVWLKALKLTNLGSINASDVSNFRLYVDGTMIGSAVGSFGSDRSLSFDFSASPLLLSTQTHVVKVLADITGGSSRTVQLSIQRSSDALFVDSQLNQPVTPLVGASTFSAVTTAAITINSVSGATGVSVSLDAASPTSNVAVGATNVKWATFDFLASGEPVKVNDLYVFASSTKSTGALDGVGGLNNGKVFVNGVQVGSTKDIGSLVAAKTDFSLGSSMILPAGTITKVDIYADSQDTAGTNLTTAGTVIVSLAAATSNGQGQSSLNAVNVPNAAVNSNTITVTSSTLTAAKYTGYGNQTLIAGANNAKIGAFTLSTGGTEGVNVNTIGINLSTVNAASMTNLWIKDDAAGGGCSSMTGQLGSTVSSPSTANTFSLSSFDIPLSSSRTIDVCANILTGAEAGPIIVGLDYTTGGIGDISFASATIGSSNTAASGATPAYSTLLQTITVGSGRLSVALGAGDPSSSNVLAGITGVKLGEFKFTSQNTSYTVQKITVVVPSNQASAISALVLSGMTDANGVALPDTAPTALVLSSASLPYATATFDGLAMAVPANSTAAVSVKGNISSISQQTGISGTGINISFSGGGTSGGAATFKAINSAGSALTNVNSAGTGSTGPALASNGTQYVRQSIPTISIPSGQGGTAIPTALYRFSITADNAGGLAGIEWTKVKFNIATTAASVTSVYLVDEAAPGVNLLDNTTTSASTTGTTITVDLTTNATQPQYRQVAKGQTKTYDLLGSVSGFTTGSTINISLAQDTGTQTNGAAGTVNSGNNFIWSDMSAQPHTSPVVGTASSADFTNGYLLTNFTTTQVSYHQ